MMTNQRTATTTDCIGVILAGGRSSRMGRDKAALCLNGESLLLRARQTLRQAGCSRVLLSGHARPNWNDDTIPDQLPDAGPVGGIVSTLDWAIGHAIETALLFVPVDTPLLSAGLLASMLQASDNDGCVITGSPLPLLLRTTAPVLQQVALARADIEAGQSWSIKRLVEPLTLTTVGKTDAIKTELTNVNTPVEWEGLLHELETRP